MIKCSYDNKIICKGDVILNSLTHHESLEKVSHIFKLLGDQRRMSILIHLKERKELSVSELMELLQMEQSALSHQLRILKDASLVSFSVKGKNRIYRLKDQHIYEIIQQIVEHVNE